MMAERVVDGLEVVEVHGHQRETGFRAVRALHELFEAVFQQHAVGSLVRLSCSAR